MAKVDKNVVLNRASGSLGDQIVIRQLHNGETVLAVPPRKTQKVSPKQKEQRDRFRKAAIYATAAQGKPEYETLAKRRFLSPFNVAMADFLNPPEIVSIDVSGYTGAAGQVIRIHAIDDVQVKSVSVRLAQDNGTAIENGMAVPDPSDPHHWTYTTVGAAPTVQVAVSIEATDLAGQTTSGSAHT